MRFAAPLLLLVVLLAACNSQGLVPQADDPIPVPSNDQPGPTPTPSGTATPPVDLPPATPLPTPVPCAFYAIGNDGRLWEIDPLVPSATLVGGTSVQNTSDLTITPDLRMIAITGDAAYQLDPTNGQAYSLATGAWIEGQNSLDTLPDGKLIVGGGSTRISIDLATDQKAALGYIPGGFNYSGDIAVLDATTVFESAVDIFGGPDHLIRTNLSNQQSTDIGSFGIEAVFGLDRGCDGVLYGLSEGKPWESVKPQLLHVNTSTGATTPLGFLDGPTRIWGASGPAF